VATLDALSGGRLRLGLGTGYLRGEMRAMGANPDSRLESFDSVLETMLTAWTGESVSGSGPGWLAREVHVQPYTGQPHPPLWFHGNGAFGRERAARYGGGWLGILTTEQLATTIRTAHLPDLEAARLAIEDLHRRCEASGRDPDHIALGLCGLWPMLDIRPGWDPEAIVELARAAASIGVGTLFTTICGDDPLAANETLAAFGEEVVAAVRDINLDIHHEEQRL
jgi:luciferase-like monooxygenase